MEGFVEKLIERLEEITVSKSDDGIIVGCNMGICEDDDCLKCLKKKVISIVKQLAEEYRDNEVLSMAQMNSDYLTKALDELKRIQSGGWIPCSERLPEENDNGKRFLVVDEYDVMAVCFWSYQEKYFVVAWDGSEFTEAVKWQRI